MIGRLMRWARVSLLDDDTSKYPTTQVSFNEVATPVYRYSPYGIASHPPLDSLALVLGDSSDPVALLCSPVTRTKELKSGEVQIENPEVGSRIKFDDGGNIEIETGADGSITITTPNEATMTVQGNVTIVSSAVLTLQAPTVEIEGNMNVTGNVAVTGTVTGTLDVLGGPLSTSLSTHVHGGVTSGGSSTAPPT